MNPLTVCITYDENFEPMCSHLCSNLNIEGIRIRLNKTESEKDYRSGFQSKNWYMNLSEKIRFFTENIQHLDDGEVACCSDADIQFFRPEALIKLKSEMESSDIEYMGQREQDGDHFNGGFFLLKKSSKTLDFLDRVNSEDLTKYGHAEQDVINELIPVLGINHRYLSRIKYLTGCMRKNSYVHPNIVNKIVMHHATCAYNAQEKMQQMDDVRLTIGLNPINWALHTGFFDVQNGSS